MKLRKGKARYELPPIGEVLHVAICDLDGDPWYVMNQIQPHHIPTKQESGTPRHFAIHYGYTGHELHLHPKPDKAYTLQLRFYPPVQEI